MAEVKRLGREVLAMPDFLLVLGKDTVYKDGKAPTLIRWDSIASIHPHWAVEENGRLWQCTFSFKGAKVVNITVIDLEGKEYRASMIDVRSLLGEEKFAALTGLKMPSPQPETTPEDEDEPDNPFGFGQIAEARKKEKGKDKE
jgi:hypothetical protein